MYKVVFVILHYVAVEDTIHCIESVLTNIEYEYKIIIIDNNSYNDSGLVLKEKYKDNANVIVIHLNSNLGFAKGNNVGYDYAKMYYNADFIIFINNDTMILDKNFIDKLITIYDETGFSILGPDIISLKNGSKQNPQRYNSVNMRDVRYIICYMILWHIMVSIIEITRCQWAVRIIKNIKQKLLKALNIEQKVFINNEKRLYDVQLSGACLIYSPIYIRYFEYAFYPETFMYGEEEILHYFCKKNNLKMVYDPSLTIYHKDGASLDTVMHSGFNKRMYRIKYAIKSANILNKLMKQNGTFQ
jgi:GT2 family glycosyltransferase